MQLSSPLSNNCTLMEEQVGNRSYIELQGSGGEVKFGGRNSISLTIGTHHVLTVRVH